MWTPEAAMAEQSALSRFAREAGFDPADYDGLYRWSISDIEGFWSRLWDFAGVIGEKGSIAFVPDPAHWMTGARFFPDAKINLAENLLKRRGDDVVVPLDRRARLGRRREKLRAAPTSAGKEGLLVDRSDTGCPAPLRPWSVSAPTFLQFIGFTDPMLPFFLPSSS